MKNSLKERIGSLTKKKMDQVYEGMKLIMDFPLLHAVMKWRGLNLNKIEHFSKVFHLECFEARDALQKSKKKNNFSKNKNPTHNHSRGGHNQDNGGSKMRGV